MRLENELGVADNSKHEGEQLEKLLANLQGEKKPHTMKLRTSITLVALAAIACVASAQSPVTGRSFSYKASDAINQDYSTAGNVTLKSATNVTVDPYLYITGNLSANWVVDGWGVGSDSQTNSIKFYHNETLTLQLAGFDNPAKVSGTQTGAQAISLQGELISGHQDSLNRR